MLSITQRISIFTNMPTVYTVNEHDYTATKLYLDEWSNIVDTPLIILHYLLTTSRVEAVISGSKEWDKDRLEIDVYARTDNTNGIHGATIANEIARDLILWFKQTAPGVLSAGITVGFTTPIIDLSNLEENLYRFHFEVAFIYKFF